MKQKVIYCIVAVLLFLVGFFFGLKKNNKLFAANLASDISDIKDNSYRDHSREEWKFINPLLDCGDIVNLSNKTILDLKAIVASIIKKNSRSGKIYTSSIYFRDLNNGPWFGQDEKIGFLPASLLKTPLMMNVLRQSMKDATFLKQEFIYQGQDENSGEYFKAKKELLHGHKYSIDEALSYMIKYSDNNASNVLNFAVDSTTVLQSYEDLGIAAPETINYNISAKTYSSFFRILYNSTFLSQEYSEKALKLLSETVFDKGLVAGVPPFVRVSHKFGERKLGNDQNYLHDCGIVYAPKMPYILCVMTEGRDFDEMASVIADISKAVYQTIDKATGLENK
jgi:beta-lactamase class A